MQPPEPQGTLQKETRGNLYDRTVKPQAPSAFSFSGEKENICPIVKSIPVKTSKGYVAVSGSVACSFVGLRSYKGQVLASLVPHKSRGWLYVSVQWEKKTPGLLSTYLTYRIDRPFEGLRDVQLAKGLGGRCDLGISFLFFLCEEKAGPCKWRAADRRLLRPEN